MACRLCHCSTTVRVIFRCGSIVTVLWKWCTEPPVERCEVCVSLASTTVQRFASNELMSGWVAIGLRWTQLLQLHGLVCRQQLDKLTVTELRLLSCQSQLFNRFTPRCFHRQISVSDCVASLCRACFLQLLTLPGQTVTMMMMMMMMMMCNDLMCT